MSTYPRFLIYILQILHGHLTGFHDLILLVNLDRENIFISLGTIDQILGAKWASDSEPLETDFTLRVEKTLEPGYLELVFIGRTMLIISGERPFTTLYNSIARVWIFLW